MCVSESPYGPALVPASEPIAAASPNKGASQKDLPRAKRLSLPDETLAASPLFLVERKTTEGDDITKRISVGRVNFYGDDTALEADMRVAIGVYLQATANNPSLRLRAMNFYVIKPENITHGDDQSAAYQRTDPDGANRIGIYSDTDPEFLPFTVLHELGHALFNTQQSSPVADRVTPIFNRVNQNLEGTTSFTDLNELDPAITDLMRSVFGDGTRSVAIETTTPVSQPRVGSDASRPFNLEDLGDTNDFTAMAVCRNSLALHFSTDVVIEAISRISFLGNGVYLKVSEKNNSSNCKMILLAGQAYKKCTLYQGSNTTFINVSLGLLPNYISARSIYVPSLDWRPIAQTSNGGPGTGNVTTLMDFSAIPIAISGAANEVLHSPGPSHINPVALLSASEVNTRYSTLQSSDFAAMNCSQLMNLSGERIAEVLGTKLNKDQVAAVFRRSLQINQGALLAKLSSAEVASILPNLPDAARQLLPWMKLQPQVFHDAILGKSAEWVETFLGPETQEARERASALFAQASFTYGMLSEVFGSLPDWLRIKAPSEKLRVSQFAAIDKDAFLDAYGEELGYIYQQCMSVSETGELLDRYQGPPVDPRVLSWAQNRIWHQSDFQYIPVWLMPYISPSTIQSAWGLTETQVARLAMCMTPEQFAVLGWDRYDGLDCYTFVALLDKYSNNEAALTKIFRGIPVSNDYKTRAKKWLLAIDMQTAEGQAAIATLARLTSSSATNGQIYTYSAMSYISDVLTGDNELRALNDAVVALQSNSAF